MRISKCKLEKAVSKRLKSYLKDSGVLESIILQSFKNRDTELPKLNKEISELKCKISNAENARSSLGQYLRDAAQKGAEEIARISKTISEEIEKVDIEIDSYGVELGRLEQHRQALKDCFETDKVKKYLKLVLDEFDKRCDLQKKQIIQALVPKIVIHMDNRLEIFLNPISGGDGGGSGRRKRKSNGKKFLLSKNGSGGGIRTPDQAVNSRLLYH